MKDHPNIVFTITLSAILRKGAKIGYRGLILIYNCKNYYLALDTPEILSLDL